MLYAPVGGREGSVRYHCHLRRYQHPDMKPEVLLLAKTQPVVDFLSTPEDIIEYAGRWDYGPKSVAKMGDRGIIERWIGSGEESMLEMVDAVFLITCSRVVSHELVRHRIASYQQESQRYVDYDSETPEDLFFVPPEIVDEEGDVEFFLARMGESLSMYRLMRAGGIKKQIARYVLPNATRTRIVVKMNLREWRHVIKLRTHKSAQPEMRDVMRQVHRILLEEFPEVFGDIDVEGGSRISR